MLRVVLSRSERFIDAQSNNSLLLIASLHLKLSLAARESEVIELLAHRRLQVAQMESAEMRV